MQQRTYERDVFISHAWEDKEPFVRDLAQALSASGLRVWYDDYEFTVGDRLFESIDRGLAQSQFGIVVLSPAFFKKNWTRSELDGLATKERDGQKVILPIWHKLDADGVRDFSPLLASRLAVSSKSGLDEVLRELLRAMTVELRRQGSAAADAQTTTQEYPHALFRRAAMERRKYRWTITNIGAFLAGGIAIVIMFRLYLERVLESFNSNSTAQSSNPNHFNETLFASIAVLALDIFVVWIIGWLVTSAIQVTALGYSRRIAAIWTVISSFSWTITGAITAAIFMIVNPTIALLLVIGVAGGLHLPSGTDPGDSIRFVLMLVVAFLAFATWGLLSGICQWILSALWMTYPRHWFRSHVGGIAIGGTVGLLVGLNVGSFSSASSTFIGIAVGSATVGALYGLVTAPALPESPYRKPGAGRLAGRN